MLATKETQKNKQILYQTEKNRLIKFCHSWKTRKTLIGWVSKQKSLMNPRNNKENYALYAKTYEIFGNNIRNISCFSYSFLRSLIFWRNYIFYLFSVSHHFNDKERNKEWRKLLIYLIYDKCPKIINQLNLNMFLNTFFFFCFYYIMMTILKTKKICLQEFQ